MPSAKLFSVVFAMFFLSACATLTGGKSATADELESSQAQVAALVEAVKQLESDKAALQKRLTKLKRERDQLANAAADEPEEDPIEMTSVASSVAPAPPPLRNQAVVDDANAPELAQTDVPIENSPRLVQPAFASSETVFENEADGEIQTRSVLYGVHLASYRLAEEAREGWRKLQRENPDELGLLEPRTEPITVDDKGLFLRLIGGGFSSNEKAYALCAKLKQKGLFCSVVSFQGQRLSLAEE